MTMSEGKPVLTAICPEPQNYSDSGLAAIEEVAALVSAPMSDDELKERIPDFDLLFVRLQTRVDRELLEAGTRLRAVVSPTTGLNHIDLDAAADLGIKVFHLRGRTEFLRSIPSTAEHTWGLMLSLTRKIPSAYAAVKSGQWEQEPYRGNELHGKRLGILGCGRLGSTVAHYGRAFGMKVATYDPYAAFVPSYVNRRESLQSLLTASDILSVHVPLNDETAGMIGAEELRLLPNGAILINTSRGEIVDEPALVSALRSGRLAGAAVDVVQHELDPATRGAPLLKYANDHDNLIITPHIGGSTYEAMEKTDLFLLLQLTEWLNPAEESVPQKA